MARSIEKKIYQIHLSFSLILILILLGIISLFSSFYIGLVIGKNFRNPPKFIPNQISENSILFEDVEKNKLEFHKLNKDEKIREKLDREMFEKLSKMSQISEKTEEILKNEENFKKEKLVKKTSSEILSKNESSNKQSSNLSKDYDYNRKT